MNACHALWPHTTTGNDGRYYSNVRLELQSNPNFPFFGH